MQGSHRITRFLICCGILLLTNLQTNAEDVVRFTPELKKAALNYSRILPFQDGLAPVKRDGKWGFINMQDQVVFPFIYDGPAQFSNGYAQVCRDGKHALINTLGEELMCQQSDLYMPLLYGTWKAQLDDGSSATLIINEGQITEIVKKRNKLVSKRTKSYTIDYQYSEGDSFLDTNMYYDYIYFINTGTVNYKIVLNSVYGPDDSKFEKVSGHNSSDKTKKKHKTKSQKNKDVRTQDSQLTTDNSQLITHN